MTLHFSLNVIWTYKNFDSLRSSESTVKRNLSDDMQRTLQFEKMLQWLRKTFANFNLLQHWKYVLTESRSSFSVLNFWSCLTERMTYLKLRRKYVVTSWENTHLIHSKWSNFSFWVKIVVTLSVAHRVTTIFST